MFVPVPVTGLVKAFCLLLKVVQSPEDKYPSWDPLACCIVISGVNPPASPNII